MAFSTRLGLVLCLASELLACGSSPEVVTSSARSQSAALFDGDASVAIAVDDDRSAGRLFEPVVPLPTSCICKCCDTSTCEPYDCAPYTCNTTTSFCRSTCSTNSDCVADFVCSNNSCEPRVSIGGSCSSLAQCVTTAKGCVNGVCCTTTSCPTGSSCANTGKPGVCSKNIGQACAANAECGTGRCVDGVCCDLACSGQCEACNTANNVGRCTAITGAPRGTRTACPGTGTCQSSCNGVDRAACGAFPGEGIACATPICADAAATPTRYCDGKGVCSPSSSTSCGAYQCGPAACKTSCAGDTDCAPLYICSGTSCVTTGAPGTVCTATSQCKSGTCVDGTCCTVSSCPAPEVCSANGKGTCSRPLAAACTGDAQCGSGFCIDGYCCNRACDGQCEGCDVKGSEGSCVPVVGAPHGARTTCAGSGSCATTCNGADRTTCGAFPGSSTPCAAASCKDGVGKLVSFCDGAGSCALPSTKACAPYSCDVSGVACLTSCALGTECAAGYTCRDGACVPKAGVPCNSADECASGTCVDGVCCDRACDGQCEACDIPGAEGRCSGVSGAPHGTRPKCFDGGTEVCKALACDGAKDRIKCVGFARGPETKCLERCEAGVASEASCDGLGACADPKTTACVSYGCGGTRCKTSCTSDVDCASGYVCTGSTCAPLRATCTPDGLASQPGQPGAEAKQCAPYRCNVSNGDCFATCTASDQCGGGYLCDAGACVKIVTIGPSEEAGGCQTSRRAGSSSWLGLAMVGLALRSRRLGRLRRGP